MSTHNDDRDKVVNALGGKKGLIDSGVPAVVFLIVFNFTQEVNTQFGPHFHYQSH